MKVSLLRDSIVLDKEYETVKSEDKTFFDKLGGIEGLTKIVTDVFKSINED